MSSYHGNPNLKPVGYQHEFSKEELAEYSRCAGDMEYFIQKYCMIISLDKGLVPFELYEYQKEVLNLIHNNRKSIIMMGRQAGKSITSAAYILWYTLFNEGKTVAIIANKGASAREVLDRYQIMYECLPIWMQQGVKVWNRGDISLENGCKVFAAATTASSIRGKSINVLLIDECAIIPSNIAEEFFASAYPTISSGLTTKIIMTSTPLGMNHWWRYFNEAMPEDGIDGHIGKNGFVRMFVPYDRHPDRDEEWAESQRKTLGELKFNQEVLCVGPDTMITIRNKKTGEIVCETISEAFERINKV